MKICAYAEEYVGKAQTVLGRMLDYAVNTQNFDIAEFFALFISTGFAARFESGDFTLIAGKSGIELADLVLEKAGISYEKKEPAFNPDRTPEYWTGWALAYYQWQVNLPFKTIIEKVPVKDILNLYSPYHEMDIRQFYDKMTELILQAETTQTNLQKFRKIAGLTQEELAAKAGISVRTIQQYEQRQKNINAASVQTVRNLATVLNCHIEDLMEVEIN